MEDTVALKVRMRADAIARRDGLHPAVRRAAAETLAAGGLGSAPAPPGCVVSGFCAIGSELDPEPLLTVIAATGHPVALPVITPKGQPLVFRRWIPGEPLRSGLWGIREPFADSPAVEPDVLLVPLLAFDSRGYRLGYGAGYYDRTLAALRAKRPTLAIGVAFDEQEVGEVPIDAHDQSLDWVLTPLGARRF